MLWKGNIMEGNIFYIVKNAKTNEVWSGYKWKKGTWQKAMLYKNPETVQRKCAELCSQNYECRISRVTIQIEEV
jgi:hypothetical protein